MSRAAAALIPEMEARTVAARRRGSSSAGQAPAAFAPSPQTAPRRKRTATPKPAPRIKAPKAAVKAVPKTGRRRPASKPVAPKTVKPARRTRSHGSGSTPTGTARTAGSTKAVRRAERKVARGAMRQNARAQVVHAPLGLLDRVLRGRGWVACVGALLAGIVFLNVSLLEVNSGIAEMGERSSELRRENSLLRQEVAKLAAPDRIEEKAAKRGFVRPAPGDIRYLQTNGTADGAAALATLDALAPSTEPTVPAEDPPADPLVPVAEPEPEAPPLTPAAVATPAGGGPP